MAAPETSRAGDVLTFALVWLDYVRTRRAVPVDRLLLLVPAAHAACLCQRIRFLDPAHVSCELHSFDDSGTSAVDLADFGNLDSRLDPVASGVVCSDLTHRLGRLPHAQPVATADGSLSIRVCGLELARLTASGACHPNVEISTKVDKDLIGGFVLEFDNKLYDASVQHKLSQLRAEFVQNLFVKEF